MGKIMREDRIVIKALRVQKNGIKFASHHFLLYVVYICQKSLNFNHAFKCSHQKCKLASLNWATLYIVNSLDIIFNILCNISGLFAFILNSNPYSSDECKMSSLPNIIEAHFWWGCIWIHLNVLRHFNMYFHK